MAGLLRNCIYQGKNLFRDPGILFFAFMFPLILSFFFNIAFSGIMDFEVRNINVGVGRENPASDFLRGIEFFNVQEIKTEEAADKLGTGEITAFIDNNLDLVVAGNGVMQTIVKEVVEQIKQTVILNRPLTAIDLSVDYLADRNQEASNIVLVFYAIIAMFSLYGIFAGIETVSLLQANLSYVGIRINVTPLKKGNFLLAGIIVALILNLLSNVILLIFISCVLKIPLFSELLYSAIIIIMGNLLGVALGVFIGASNKKSNDTKTLMGIVITLVLSFFSGMMGPDIKVFIDQKLPVLARLNPISIISNSLYRINLLGSTRNIREGFMVLSLYCMVLILASYIFLRRKKYDSV